MFDFEKALKDTPTEPGIYMMRDNVGTIIYVGKAVNLRNRLRQYFQDRIVNRKVKAMVGNIAEFEYIIVDNEVESLILEQNLIKKYMPKYNILLKDDKQYPYIKISTDRKYPTITRIRLPKEDGALYFGPFTEGLAVTEAIDFFNREFSLRTCSLNLDKPNPKYKVCLNYHIDQCYGPCEGLISEEEYNKNIQEIIDFLNGRNKKLLKVVEKKMKDAADKLDFERAAHYRNLIVHMESLLTKQSVDTLSIVDKDMIAMARYEEDVAIQIFFVRGGKVIGREYYIMEDNLDSGNEEIISSFLKQYYAGYTRLPSEIYVESPLPDGEVVEEFLTRLKGTRVRIIVPKRGENRDLLNIVRKNAINTLNKEVDRYSKVHRQNIETLNELQKLLDLPTFPARIEAYDVSHIAGDQVSGSMVVFEDGQSKNSDYRRFRITSAMNDDYQSMREMLTRRLRRLKNIKNQKESFYIMPDLILMDGGKGQVNIALEVLDNLSLDIPVAGLVKDDNHITRGIIYNNDEYPVPLNTDLYTMIYKIQEEAHRFAINYHRSRMSDRLYRSELDNIKGVGPKRKVALLDHFRSVENIKAASVDKLLEIPGMPRTTAENIYQYFRGE